MHRVARDRESGTGDVRFLEIGKGLLELFSPLGVGARYSLSRFARLPDAQEPDPVESRGGEAIQLAVGNVVERRRPAQGLGQRVEPYARVDLIERRIAWRAHVIPPRCEPPRARFLQYSRVGRP